MVFLIIAAVVVLLVLLWLYLVLPARKARDMSAYFESPIAHRGIHDSDGVAENSIDAFSLAIEKGYPIEIDIRVTLDGAVYVLHDDGLERLCGNTSRLSRLTAAEAEELRLKEGGEKVPTLREVLDFVDGRVPFLIELKGDNSSSISERAYEILKDYKGIYAIQSFSPVLLGRYRRLSREVPIGILSERRRGGSLGDRLLAGMLGGLIFNFMYRPDFISYKHTDRLPLSAKLCRRLGTYLLCWTVRDKQALEAARSDYDGFICEQIGEIY